MRHSSRIEIRNDINQNFDTTSTWGFGFNLDAPDIWHEEVGAVIRAKLSTQGGHYSPSNARYDWLTLNHFADVSDGSGEAGLTLSNSDCYFMKVGNSTVSNLDSSTPQISVLAGGRVVNGSNGLLNQGGDSHFLQRFALQTHDGYDPVAVMRFALEHQNPLITGVITGGSGYPETSQSLLTISDPNVLLWALKPADDEALRKGIVTRLWNLSTEPMNVSLSLTPYGISNATHTTHIETPIEDASIVGGELAGSLDGSQLKTFLFFPYNAPPSPPRNLRIIGANTPEWKTNSELGVAG
jgi:alpha-mannosidase